MKIVLNPCQPILAQSLAASTTVALPELFAYYGFSLQVKITDGGSLAGTLTLEVSNDDVTYAAYTPLTGITAMGTTMWWVDDKIFPFKYNRLKWVHTAGTGTLDVTIVACRP